MYYEWRRPRMVTWIGQFWVQTWAIVLGIFTGAIAIAWLVTLFTDDLPDE